MRLFSRRDKICFFLQWLGVFDLFIFYFRLNIFISKISNLLLPLETKGARGVYFIVCFGHIKAAQSIHCLNVSVSVCFNVSVSVFLWFTIKLSNRNWKTETTVTFIWLIGLFSVFHRADSVASLVAEVHEIHKPQIVLKKFLIFFDLFFQSLFIVNGKEVKIFVFCQNLYLIFKYSISVMMISWVIIKSLKKEIFFVSLRPAKTSLFLAWWLFSWYRPM